MRFRLILVALIAVASATTATADKIYATGSIGSTSLAADYGEIWTQSVDGDDGSWTLGAGFQLNENLALQAEYHELGRVRGAGSPCHDQIEICILVIAPIEADSSAVSISVLPQLPLGERLRLYGKLGLMSWKTDVYDLLQGRRRITGVDGEDPLWGGGARLQLRGSVGAFAEYERVPDAFESVSLGMIVSF